MNDMTDTDSSKRKKIILVVRSIATVFALLGLLFWPAGTFNWPEAWLFLTLYFLAVGAMMIWLKKKSPDLLKERMTVKKDVKSWDRKIILIYTLCFMIMLSISGLDSVRFLWSRVPLAWQIIGFLGFVPVMVLVFWTMRENAYLAQYVRIQKERGHQVCSTGPYRYVRHPMYVGVIFMFFCIPLALGSFYALIPGTVMAFLFILRTSLEDKTLQEELPGYKEYTLRVCYKLIPGIW